MKKNKNRNTKKYYYKNNNNKSNKTNKTNKEGKNNMKATVNTTTKKFDTYDTFSTYYSSSFKKEKEKPYVYKGIKNKTSFPEFVELCKMTQEELKECLPKYLINVGYTDVIVDDGYIYAKGNIPFLVTAHMDTVHKSPVTTYYEYVNENGEHILSSPQGIGGDDRCGIYMIMEIVKEMKPSVLFCEDEESGGIGSSKFCKTEFIEELKELKFMIELDRANGNDAVFYDCANKEFIEFIEDTIGYKEAWGSFSDISNLAPACKVAAVNLSCGYYHAHTLQEEVNVEEMLYTLEMAKKLLQTETEQFEYVEEKFSSYGYGYYGYNNRKSYSSYAWYDDDDYEDYYLDTNKEIEFQKGDKVLLFVYFYDKLYKENYVESSGATVDEAWGRFFKEYPSVCYNDVIDYEIDNIK